MPNTANPQDSGENKPRIKLKFKGGSENAAQPASPVPAPVAATPPPPPPAPVAPPPPPEPVALTPPPPPPPVQAPKPAAVPPPPPPATKPETPFPQSSGGAKIKLGLKISPSPAISPAAAAAYPQPPPVEAPASAPAPVMGAPDQQGPVPPAAPPPPSKLPKSPPGAVPAPAPAQLAARQEKARKKPNVLVLAGGFAAVIAVGFMALVFLNGSKKSEERPVAVKPAIKNTDAPDPAGTPATSSLNPSAPAASTAAQPAEEPNSIQVSNDAVGFLRTLDAITMEFQGETAIIVDNIIYNANSLLEPDLGIRFAGVKKDTGELIFQDGSGKIYLKRLTKL